MNRRLLISTTAAASMVLALAACGDKAPPTAPEAEAPKAPGAQQASGDVTPPAVASASQGVAPVSSGCEDKRPLEQSMETHSANIDFTSLAIKDGKLTDSYVAIHEISKKLLAELRFFDVSKVDHLNLYTGCVATGFKLRRDQFVPVTIMDAGGKKLLSGKVQANAKGVFVFVRD